VYLTTVIEWGFQYARDVVSSHIMRVAPMTDISNDGQVAVPHRPDPSSEGYDVDTSGDAAGGCVHIDF
jgi:hypothetical protein